MVGREESPRVSAHVGITVFARPLRLARIFESFERFGWPSVPVVVYEDPSDEQISTDYRQLCNRYNVLHQVASTWGCMQGIAQFALEQTKTEWFIYLPDDILPTPGSIEFVLQWLRIIPSWVGAVQIPYWNYESWSGRDRESMFEGGLDWLEHVPFNPHWWGPALYVNLNGSGFALRRSVWEQVGGFSPKTWCLDEDISCKIWLKTPDSVVATLPGPPWIHQGGASTPDQFKFGHAHGRWSKIEGWLDEWGMEKDVTGGLCREVMQVRSVKYGWPAR
jgi:hypothetical protein